MKIKLTRNSLCMDYEWDPGVFLAAGLLQQRAMHTTNCVVHNIRVCIMFW